jgi:hypothetical protein
LISETELSGIGIKLHFLQESFHKGKYKMDLARRAIRGKLNPVPRMSENSKAYNRKKSQAWKRDFPPTSL